MQMTIDPANGLGAIGLTETGDDGAAHRRVIESGHFEGTEWIETDVSSETAAVQAAAQSAWTPEVRQAWQDLCRSHLFPSIDLKAHAANKRWQVEIGGVTVGGAHVATTRDDQAMITGAYTFAKDNPGTTIKFKSASGWVSLPAPAMLAIGSAVGSHVQACFAAEELVDADIAAGTITTTAQIDADSRWPAT